MLDKLSIQQRTILAIALSLIFFIIYDYFMVPKTMQMRENNNSHVTTQSGKQAAPAPAAEQTAAPAPSTLSSSTRSSDTSAAAPVKKTAFKILATIDADEYQAQIDTLGRIARFEVRIPRFKQEDGTYPNVISDQNPLKPLEIRYADPKLNEEAFKTPFSADHTKLSVQNGGATLTLTQRLSGIQVVKKITFFPNGTYKIAIDMDKEVEYYLSPGFRPDIESDAYTFKGILLREADGRIKTIEDGDMEQEEHFPAIQIAAANDKYYTTNFYDFKNGMDVYVSKDEKNDPLLFVKGTPHYTLNGYIGPKEYDKLAAIDKRMTDVIEYGFFTFISKPLFIFLKYLHKMLGNWGWAIVALTLIIRLLLYPLTFKGMVSMNKLKELSPKIKEIQAKYKKDPQKMNAKMMELYKKHGANPMGGCLPMLMQIPIFFAFYRVLLNTIELKHAPWFGWIQDLSVMDPYFILPVLMGATMFWQQTLTPTNFTDPMQEKIMKFLPLIFTFFFITFPAGLTLYWFTNNLFSVAQQYYVNRIFDRHKAAKEANHG